MFVFTLLVAVVCAWYRTNQQRAVREERLLASIPHQPLDPFADFYTGQDCVSYCGPEWLARLVGSRHLSFLNRVTLLWVRSDDLERIGASLRGLPSLEMLVVLKPGEQLTDGAIAELDQLVQLRSLCLNGVRMTPAQRHSLEQALPNCEIKCSKE